MEKCYLCDDYILGFQEIGYTEDGDKCHKRCIEIQDILLKEKEEYQDLLGY